MKAAVLPAAACGNTLPLILTDVVSKTMQLGKLNALVLVFVVRQKVLGQNLS